MNLTLKKRIKSRILRRLLRYESQADFPYRKYFLAHECIFIHIPKCAGTSILHALAGNEYHRDHCTFRDYLSADSRLFHTFFKFSFCRHPFDRAASTYRYLSSGGNRMDDFYFSKIIKDSFPDFERFVLDYLDEYRIHEHRMFLPQYLFLYDHKRTLMADYVGRYEDLERGYDFVAKKIGLAVQLPKLNTSPGNQNNFEEFFSNPAVSRKLTTLYMKDFELLGYDPDHRVG